VFPLRYLVVRLPTVHEAWVTPWLAAGRTGLPLLRFLGQYGDDDLYEVVSLPESAWRIERVVSHDFLRAHPLLEVGLRPLTEHPEREQFVDLWLNGRNLERVPLAAPVATRVPVRGAMFQAAPNTIALEYGYTIRPGMAGERHRIGQTGASSPADLWIRSAGHPYGDEAVIRVNGRQVNSGLRGYNLVAIPPAGGPPQGERFDTFRDAKAARRLAAWIESLAPGTVVAGAIRDEASGLLTQEAVDALRSLGVSGDIRGRYRESHAFVGAKGAAPGTALEDLGPRPVEILVGRLREAGGLEGGFELSRFALR
jgi:hypothetical protein